MWGMKVSLPLPQHGLLRKASGLQLQVFPMLPRQDYFIGVPDIAFILPWLDHPEERARSSEEAVSERSNKGMYWSLGWTTMGAALARALDKPFCWCFWPWGSPSTLTEVHYSTSSACPSPPRAPNEWGLPATQPSDIMAHLSRSASNQDFSLFSRALRREMGR